MGEVISISRVSDLDIFSEFDSQCPAIPKDIEAAIQMGATTAINKQNAVENPASFRTTCVAVVLLSLLALVAVKYIAGRVVSSIGTNHYSSQYDPATMSWRQSRESWQSYISQLESDPFHKHLQAEKQLFKVKFPGS